MDVGNNIYRQYRIALAVCFAIGIVLLALLLVYGKEQSFLLINGWNTPMLDRAMPYVTYLGDGLIYIPVLLITWFFRRDYIIAIIAGIVICFLFTHSMKWYIFPGELRPFSLEAKNIAIHKVPGIKLHENYSFPSGHTATAFTTALLLAALQRRRAWVVALPFVALMVGYSRIYLAQHFLTDVTAGLFIGMAASFLSLLIYRKLRTWRLERQKRPSLP
ncbi:MAG: phosphatase PAP2 family protein [Chitinophagaceae bacterium]|nr:MAG: phosphatase PAP2 family protein [Chitinophagaceae bacterium]